MQSYRSIAVSLGMVGVLLVGTPGLAQTPSSDSTTVPGRLTVRPHVMATGTRTAQAGIQELDSVAGDLVYVPPSCVGTRRCPLVVYLHGGQRSPETELALHAPLADKYGMIILAPSAMGGAWDAVDQFLEDPSDLDVDSTAPHTIRVLPYAPDVENLDCALREVLRLYAIDPDKIAVAGFSIGGAYASFLGASNSDLFSRVAVMSPTVVLRSTGAPVPATQFFLSAGLVEPRYVLKEIMGYAVELRHAGHAVEQWLGLRAHENRPEEFDRMWHWLQTSWAASGAAPPAAPPAPDTLPVLAKAALQQMTTFWTRFMQEPDSIRQAGRLAHLTAVSVPVGQEQFWVLMADMGALAAIYPSVAADLKAAGLTAPEQAAFRRALISANATMPVDAVSGVISATSVLGKNLAFLASPDGENTLGDTGIWMTP